MPFDKFGLWDLTGPNKLWQLFILASAEILGTAVLLFVGCSAAIPFNDAEPPLLHVAIAFGFAITIVVMAIGHISGAHINPAVTVSALVLGKLSPLTSLVYIISQCFGAIIGMQSVLVISPGNISAEFCANKIDPSLSPIKGILIECILTSVLVLLVCSAWDERNSNKHDSIALRFGAGVIALVVAGAKFTGCSMNPARSLAPAILSGYWKNHWVYWIGPLAGGAIMSIIYKVLYLKNYNNSKSNSKNISISAEDPVENEPLTKKNKIVLETISNEGYVKPAS